MKFALFSAALIAGVGFLIYANSLGGDFLWDDYHLVKRNAYIRDFSNIPRIFTEHVGGGAKRKYHFYRPLQILSYAFDYAIWKGDVRGYRLTNVFLHILAALCVAWLALTLSGDRPLSLLAGLLFVTHPLHTEAVAYISGRADPLAAIFILLAVILYIKNIDLSRQSYDILTALMYGAALLSRESALALPLLLLVYHFAFGKKIRAGRFLPLLGLAGASPSDSYLPVVAHDSEAGWLADAG